MKQKTAIRQLIELLEKHIDWIEGNHKAERVDIYDVVAKAQELEPVNEQDIKDAWNNGHDYSADLQLSVALKKPSTNELYFNETFEKP
jgi:hypothetical protein